MAMQGISRLTTVLWCFSMLAGGVSAQSGGERLPDKDVKALIEAVDSSRDRFEDKGRYAEYLGSIPTYVIKTELPAFIGLAHSFTEPGPRWEAE